MFESLPNSFLTLRGDALDDRSETDRFTPLERIAVIVVLTPCICFGALGLLQAVFNWRCSIGQGDIAPAKAQIKQFDTALVAYKMMFRKFPYQLEGLLAPPVGKPIMNLKAIPEDPWGTPYLYLRLPTKGYVIVSLGADGEPGGEGEDADICSNEIMNETAEQLTVN